MMSKSLTMLLVIYCTITSCGPRSDKENKEFGTPAPVTEEDKQRYNLNAPDELREKSLDSVYSDTTGADTLRPIKHQ